MNEVQFNADGRVLIVTTRSENNQHVIEFKLSTDVPCVLHWGFRGRSDRWQRPAENMWPEGTRSADSLSVDTEFKTVGARLAQVTIRHDAPGKFRGLAFVLYFPDSKRWVKDGAKDYFIPLQPDSAVTDISQFSDEIIEAEVNSPHWSLMHRFNLCYDLLTGIQSDPKLLQIVYVWLRFSAIRQLDWQRQFNTKPRELSHALDRLTMRVVAITRKDSAQGFWARQILSTLGRGGEGQKVRDEILNIMHRHHIKETQGRFMEEWHQKLHNNTTSDDVVICEAFLAFLYSKGDLVVFYSTLERNGVTRERMRSFERPIKTDPQYTPDNASGLIHDFEYYLTILKALHSGLDFDSAFAAASRHLSTELKSTLSELTALRNSSADTLSIAEKLTAARIALTASFPTMKDDASLRDLLFLDLALEALFRQAVERQPGTLNIESIARFLDLALRQALLTIGDEELRVCTRHWASLIGIPRESEGWASHAISVTHRVGRSVQDISSRIYQDIQPSAESLGKGLKVQEWTLPLFSEEVVRGNIVFALSLLLRHLDPLLRSAAGLGGWQVVSSHPVSGKVHVVDSLMSVQGQRFEEPTLLVTDGVSGNEDIPEGVTAVITNATVDLVSHAAVRARNAKILCATCFDAEPYATLKKSEGEWLALEISPAGSVLQHKVDRETSTAKPVSAIPKTAPALGRRNFTNWAIPSAEFDTVRVGGKSNNLNALRGHAADWIGYPKSIALPFGVFEQLLGQDCNRQVNAQYRTLLEIVESDIPGTLAKIRALIAELQPITAFEAALRATWEREQFPALNWDEAWKAIKQVWASKWNDRAYLSRRALRIPHDDLTVAVLIQEVVEAEYAYVLHTANPITGNREEIFGEIVLGLGETLVGNHPGSALGFICSKRDGQKKIVSYPGKSYGLYGAGVIFRSDSNGEDLEDFAGAGLYDSVLGREPERRRLDYTGEPLIWDKKFRNEMIDKIARIGLETEKIFNAAQDIEGTVSHGRYFVVQTRPQVGLK